MDLPLHRVLCRKSSFLFPEGTSEHSLLEQCVDGHPTSSDVVWAFFLRRDQRSFGAALLILHISQWRSECSPSWPACGMCLGCCTQPRKTLGSITIFWTFCGSVKNQSHNVILGFYQLRRTWVLSTTSLTIISIAFGYGLVQSRFLELPA